MKFTIGALCLSVAVLAGGAAHAGADDVKWVAKCVSDNADAKVSVEVVTKYCTCMNNKMDDNETLSITAWEKKNPAEMKACEKEAGWK
ncbi:hypothetical protein [Magnetospirillum sp. SS-4]|uniref:hypothetical protein n=1 Tax=Magnetospirillum sp. SS-4 TaxID=2681465 RepID=UPI001383BCE6|nr:hypothetical protein [Magnetospirillum sp. SS-4]CAA7620945.1 conserved exported hypothetical protein [Magnetospirillum sp. SS-4]